MEKVYLFKPTPYTTSSLIPNAEQHEKIRQFFGDENQHIIHQFTHCQVETDNDIRDYLIDIELFCTEEYDDEKVTQYLASLPNKESAIALAKTILKMGTSMWLQYTRNDKLFFELRQLQAQKIGNELTLSEVMSASNFAVFYAIATYHEIQDKYLRLRDYTVLQCRRFITGNINQQSGVEYVGSFLSPKRKEEYCISEITRLKAEMS